jgi:hypothetical protein
MKLTRLQALFIALGLSVLGVAAARGGPAFQSPAAANPAILEPTALARGDIVVTDPPPAIPGFTYRRS